MTIAIVIGSPEYRRHYVRGWNASRRAASNPHDDRFQLSPLERADIRGEVDPWYDGYMDHAAGRPRWHAVDGSCEIPSDTDPSTYTTAMPGCAKHARLYAALGPDHPATLAMVTAILP